jgi:hypothetical protein
VVTVSAGEDT